MAITNYAKREIAFMIGGSTTGSIGNMLIGIGSSTVQLTDTELVTPSDRQDVTITTFPSLRKINWQFDWNSPEMSGTTLTEFGMLPSGANFTGSLWSRNVIPALVFDGTNELRIDTLFEVF